MSVGLQILLGVLSGGVGVALVTGIKELILWKLNRRATVSDRNDDDHIRLEKLEKKVAAHHEKDPELYAQLASIQEKLTEFNRVSVISDRILLQARIKSMALDMIEAGECIYEDRKFLHKMWKIYHYELGGNGDLDLVMSAVDALPLKQAVVEE